MTPAKRTANRAHRGERIAHALTDQPVCPWCGESRLPPSDHWWCGDEVNVLCFVCVKTFRLERQVRTTYTTSKE